MRVGVVATPDPGHALPAIGLAGALADRGHQVIIHTGEQHADLARAHGVDPQPLPQRPRAAADDAGFGQRLYDQAGALCDDLVDHWQEWPPDVVVVDTLARGGAFAAQRLGCPWIELISHHLPDPDPQLPPIGLGRRPARSALRRRDDRRLVARQRRSIDQGRRQQREAAAKLGIHEPIQPALRLLATLPALERHRARWPADAHVVGCLAADPIGPALEPPGGRTPLVVVTDSTVEGVGTLGALAATAFAGTGLRVAITTSRLSPRRAGPLVVGWGPHQPLLAEAAVAVGHGGGGFLAKVAAAGVPAVIVPVQGDQLEAAARWRDTGAGRVLGARRLTAGRLRRAVVRHLADPDAAVAASRLAAEAAQLGPAVAAALVEQVARGERPRAGSAAHHLDVAVAPAADDATDRHENDGGTAQPGH